MPVAATELAKLFPPAQIKKPAAKKAAGPAPARA